jgi:UDP-N-acetylmuramate--alanine ligase
MKNSVNNLNVFIIGIGGIGMSGIAEILLSIGYGVYGSDLNDSYNVKRLREMGATVEIGHRESNIHDKIDIVIYSAAIPKTNPEYAAAKAKQLPIMRRAEIIAELMRLKKGIAIAGTHGKTTTTSFVSTILHEAKLDPTCLVGGIVRFLKSNARVGEGDFILVEADESDGAFLSYNPVYSVVTNIDDDHIDHYGSVEEIEKAFLKFINNVAFFGKSILNIDDEKIRAMVPGIKKPWVSISVHENGITNEADYIAKNLKVDEMYSSFEIVCRNGESFQAQVNLPGRHNVYNALSSFALCKEIGIDPKVILDALKSFEGVGRRFERVFVEDKKVVIDDYAHHPSEVVNCLGTARRAFSNRKVVAVFEPHRFTRTQQCWDQFLHCFNDVDKAYILPIYPASESPIAGISTENLVRDINKLHPDLAVAVSSFDETLNTLMEDKEDKAVVCMGAGKIGREISLWASSKK